MRVTLAELCAYRRAAVNGHHSTVDRPLQRRATGADGGAETVRRCSFLRREPQPSAAAQLGHRVLIRISYGYMIFFITIMVAQLYSLLHGFSDALVVLRLEETAIGAAAGIPTAR